jgi:dienelactone hydrolase
MTDLFFNRTLKLIYGDRTHFYSRRPVPDSRGAAVILHGYGGSKEEQLGLAWRVAEEGLAACAIDYRGHGEHPIPLDSRAGEDLDAAIRFSRRFGKVTAIGHSLGGRLALISTVDYRIALSPSLSRTYGERTQELLKAMSSYRVRPADLSALLAVQESLPVWKPGQDRATTRILYAERDAPEIAADCQSLKAAGVRVIAIPGALHGDIFLLEQTLSVVRDQVREWYGTGA